MQIYTNSESLANFRVRLSSLHIIAKCGFIILGKTHLDSFGTVSISQAVPVRGKAGLTHGDFAGAVPCVERAVLRTATLPKLIRAWKGLFRARRLCRNRSVLGKGGFAHGDSAETDPCLVRAVLRTAALSKHIRAWEGPFGARHPRRTRPVRGKAGFAHGDPA